MSTSPHVSAYVRIPGGCAMSCRYVGREDIEILIGGYRDGFEFVVQREALERLVELGQEALAGPVEEDMNDSVVELPVAGHEASAR